MKRLQHRMSKSGRPIAAFFSSFHSRHTTTHMPAGRATQAARKTYWEFYKWYRKIVQTRTYRLLTSCQWCHIRAHRKRLSQRAESVSSLSVSVPSAGDRVPNVLQSCQNGSLLWAYPTAQATLQQHSYSLQSALRPGITRSCMTATPHVWFWHRLDLARTTLGA